MRPAAIIVARDGALIARVGVDPGQTEFVEAVADQLPGAFGGVAAAPVPPHQPITQVGLASDPRLIGSVWRLQGPPADEDVAVNPIHTPSPGTSPAAAIWALV